MKISAMMMSLLAVSSPCWAEPPTGSRLGSRHVGGRELPKAEAAAAARTVVSCLVAKRTSVARDLLNATTDEDYRRLYARLGSELSCLNASFSSELYDQRKLTTDRGVFRGLVAEDLLRRSLGTAPAMASQPIEKSYERDWFRVSGRHVAIDEMATCVAAVNPAVVFDLISAAPQTSAEAAVLSRLVPTMSQCLRAGANLDADRNALRAALAEALYQRSVAPAIHGGTAPVQQESGR